VSDVDDLLVDKDPAAVLQIFVEKSQQDLPLAPTARITCSTTERQVSVDECLEFEFDMATRVLLPCTEQVRAVIGRTDGLAFAVSVVKDIENFLECLV
jgi:hypothetical protein